MIRCAFLLMGILLTGCTTHVNQGKGSKEDKPVPLVYVITTPNGEITQNNDGSYELTLDLDKAQKVIAFSK